MSKKSFFLNTSLSLCLSFLWSQGLTRIEAEVAVAAGRIQSSELSLGDWTVNANECKLPYIAATQMPATQYTQYTIQCQYDE